MANELKFNLTIKNTITTSIQSKINQLDKLPDEAFKIFKEGDGTKQYPGTPKRTGNARRNTRLDKTKDEIIADYPYAQRLDEGYSQKAPQGMTKPTEKFIQKRLRQIMRKK